MQKGVCVVMYCRGIRGATTVERNDREEILAATTELLQLLIERNDYKPKISQVQSSL